MFSGINKKIRKQNLLWVQALYLLFVNWIHHGKCFIFDHPYRQSTIIVYKQKFWSHFMRPPRPWGPGEFAPSPLCGSGDGPWLHSPIHYLHLYFQVFFCCISLYLTAATAPQGDWGTYPPVPFGVYFLIRPNSRRKGLGLGGFWQGLILCYFIPLSFITLFSRPRRAFASSKMGVTPHGNDPRIGMACCPPSPCCLQRPCLTVAPYFILKLF